MGKNWMGRLKHVDRVHVHGAARRKLSSFQKPVEVAAPDEDVPPVFAPETGGDPGRRSDHLHVGQTLGVGCLAKLAGHGGRPPLANAIVGVVGLSHGDVEDDGQNLTPLTIREKHCLEKAVGKLMRRFIDVGAYPVDAHLDHFLAMKADGTDILVYYVDLERIKFDFVLKRLLRRRKLVMTLGRLVARLEWFRASGGRINRPSMMRIGHAYFNIGVLGTLDRRLCRVVVKAARKFWYRRGFHVRGRYLLRSFQRYE